MKQGHSIFYRPVSRHFITVGIVMTTSCTRVQCISTCSQQLGGCTGSGVKKKATVLKDVKGTFCAEIHFRTRTVLHTVDTVDVL